MKFQILYVFRLRALEKFFHFLPNAELPLCPISQGEQDVEGDDPARKELKAQVNAAGRVWKPQMGRNWHWSKGMENSVSFSLFQKNGVLF